MLRRSLLLLSTVVPLLKSDPVRLRILPVALVKESAVVVAFAKIPLVKEPEVAKRLVVVAEVSESTVPVPLVKERLVALKLVEVALVSTVEEARSVPGRVRVFTADR